MLLGIAFLAPGSTNAGEPRKTENVIIVTLDGFRWQELFGGADETLLDKRFGGVRDVADLKRRFWRLTAAERREALLPFFWGTIAKEGQVFGDPAKNAAARLTNGLKFSYPGYSEMFCGFPDPRIDSNDKRPNPNLSVLEYLNGRPPYKGRVAAFCTWDVFPFIFRADTSGLKVQAGWVDINDAPLTPRQRMTNDTMARLPRYWTDNTFDITTMEAAREHLLRHKPRVLYIGLGESDEWGHGRRYDLYLGSVYNADRYIAELWQTLQQMPQYKDKTALLLTTDHGRGITRVDWTDHGKKVPGAEFVWIAVMGPDTPKLGVRSAVSATQSQIAATIARLLGEDFQSACPKAAGPLPDLCTVAQR
jgi:hypothetical protein